MMRVAALVPTFHWNAIVPAGFATCNLPPAGSSRLSAEETPSFNAFPVHDSGILPIPVSCRFSRGTDDCCKPAPPHIVVSHGMNVGSAR